MARQQNTSAGLSGRSRISKTAKDRPLHENQVSALKEAVAPILGDLSSSVDQLLDAGLEAHPGVGPRGLPIDRPIRVSMMKSFG